MTQCGWKIAWVGECLNTTPCADHPDKLCACGEPAVGECTIASSLVCGAPVCVEHWPTCIRHSNAKA